MQRDPAYRGRWAGRFDCLLADEYQDVNQAQYTWLRLFGARHGEVFVVGDDDQAIFGFRSADLDLHTALCPGLPRGRTGPAGGELPLHRTYPGGSERRHLP